MTQTESFRTGTVDFVEDVFCVTKDSFCVALAKSTRLLKKKQNTEKKTPNKNKKQKKPPKLYTVKNVDRFCCKKL